MEYFESHAHYDDERFDNDREKIIQSLQSEKVTKVISAGYSLAGSKRAIELANKYQFMYCTVGISPNDIDDNYEDSITEIDKILQNYYNEKQCSSTISNETIQSKEEQSTKSKIVAVGEIGLDYHYDTDKEKQRKAFIKQIEIANKYKLPIVIHTREAVSDTLQILKENSVERKGVFHCCPFNRELVKEALKLGFYISFSGTVTFKNSKNAEEIVKMVPEDKFVIETDSPYLAPEPVRGTRNDSRNLKHIVKKIAEFKNLKEEIVAKKSYENTKRLFEIKWDGKIMQ